MQQPPTIVVVNQPPPVTPTSWYHEVDGAAAGGCAAVLLLFVVVAVCLLLRRFRPQTWKMVKGVALKTAQWAALPVSWAFSKASDALRSFHHSATLGTDQQAAVSQV